MSKYLVINILNINLVSIDNPKYIDLIELLEQSTDATMLKEKFISIYPHIAISRADRFHNSCERIAAPYRKNSFTDADALQEYLQRVWSPRIRNLPKGI